MLNIRALPKKVIVSSMLKGERLVNGIIIMDDNGKEQGIRPRWAKVISAGTEVTDVHDGQWVLIEHGRWTRPFYIRDENDDIEMFEVEETSLLMISDEEPTDDIVKETFMYDTPPKM